MIIILNIFRGNFRGITLWPFIILKNKELKENKEVINHERIHLRQQAELLVIPFYFLYLLEWVYRKLFTEGNAYRNLSFEREAYSNQDNLDYLKNRKMFTFAKYFIKK